MQRLIRMLYRNGIGFVDGACGKLAWALRVDGQLYLCVTPGLSCNFTQPALGTTCICHALIVQVAIGGCRERVLKLGPSVCESRRCKPPLALAAS